jgi:hypothetical protein
MAEGISTIIDLSTYSEQGIRRTLSWSSLCHTRWVSWTSDLLSLGPSALYVQGGVESKLIIIALLCEQGRTMTHLRARALEGGTMRFAMTSFWYGCGIKI